MRRGPGLALALLTLVPFVALGAGCGGTEAPETRELVLRDYLETTPEACGLGRQPVDLEELPDLPTVDAQLAAVFAAVERLRGLQPTRPIRPTFRSESEFEERLSQVVTREFTVREAELAERALVLLGAVRPAFELREQIVDALRDQHGRVLRPRRQAALRPENGDGKARSVRPRGARARVRARLQRPGAGHSGGARSGRLGRHCARGAVARRGVGDSDGAPLPARAPRSGHTVFVLGVPFDAGFETLGLPHYLNRLFAFPYVEGIGFVCRLYARGGWKAVAAAYQRPPGSSAEILFPERYLRGERPVQPRALGRLGRGWTRVAEQSGSFGAADLRALFEAPGDEVARALDRPLERAAAWGGGRLDLWIRGDETALGISLVERGSRRRLCESIGTWYDRAFPEAHRRGGFLRAQFEERGQAAVVRCRGAEVLIGIGPDPATAGRLVGLG